MANFHIVYSTTDGHTLEICQRIAQVLEGAGHHVESISVEQATDFDWANCDRVVLGARIRYGKHHPLVYAFIRKHVSELAARRSALFSVNLVARKPEKSTAETNPYLKKFLREIPWRPTEVTVFAGKIDYRKYGFLDRQIIRFIMWLTHGPTAADACVDYTDWQAVEAFARRLA